MDYNTPLYDSSLMDEERASWLLSQLTLEQKFGWFTLRISNERLGLRVSTCGGEGAHGVQARAGQREKYPPTATTSFTQPIGMAATFDRQLIRKAGDVMGRESRAFANAISKQGHCRLAPTVDLCRDPRWGRTEEGYGEDPYLTGKMASAYIQGMQDEHNHSGKPLATGERGDRIRTAAVLKHFYANNQEWHRCTGNAEVSEKIKHDYLLEPFRYCAQEGHAEGVMTSYNEINHLPAMLNHEVRETLKKKWGIHYAMTDGGDFLQTVNFHHFFASHAQTLAAGVKAGINAMLDQPAQVTKAARAAYEQGLITQDELDESVFCTIMELIRQGAFDLDDPYANLDMTDVGNGEARNVSLQMSKASNVLLKNADGFLPFSTKDQIALVGPVGDRWFMDWYGGKPLYKVTLKEGIEQQIGHSIPFDNGLHQIRLKAGEKYIGADVPEGQFAPSEMESPELLLVDHADQAVIFEQTNWGCGSNFLYAPAYQSYLTVDEAGKITLGSTEPFSWFIFESFTIGMADAEHKPDPRNANSVELSHYWNDEEAQVRIHCFGNRNIFIENGRLKTDPLIRRTAESNTKEGNNEATSWMGSSKEAYTLTVEMVSNGIERAKKLAATADKVIVALGCNPMVNAKEEIDRSTIEMIPLQQKLLEEICKVNPNACVVLMTNYPYAINWMQEHVPAILLNATGSQDMGHGLAAAIFGEAAPAGRLPMTWYKSDNDLPPMEDYDLITHPRTYRYFNKPVLYPFGYGLTYTTFNYHDLLVVINKDGLRVSVKVANTGSVTSDEVVQIYIRRISESVTVHPLRRLIGFTRLHDIVPGSEIKAEFVVDPCDLSIYIESMGEKVVEPGRYVVYAGRSCMDEQVSQQIELK